MILLYPWSHIYENRIQAISITRIIDLPPKIVYIYTAHTINQVLRRKNYNLEFAYLFAQGLA